MTALIESSPVFTYLAAPEAALQVAVSGPGRATVELALLSGNATLWAGTLTLAAPVVQMPRQAIGEDGTEMGATFTLVLADGQGSVEMDAVVVSGGTTSAVSARVASWSLDGAYFNVQIQNNSGIPDAAVYVTAFGQAFDPLLPAPWLSADQSFVALTSDGYGWLATPTASTSSLSYSYALGSLTATDGVYNLFLPACSGRVYLSIGAPLCLSIGTGGGTTISDPQATLPQDPNYQVIYDKFEFYWNPAVTLPPIAATAVIDTTAVDYFGLPLTLAMNGVTMGVSQSLSDVQAVLLSGNAAATPPQRGGCGQAFAASWGMLPVYGSNGTVVRVLSPLLFPSGPFPADYLDSFIAGVWSHYASSSGNTLSIMAEWTDASNGVVSATYTGSVDAANQFVFTSSAPGAPSVSLPPPAWATVFACSGPDGWTPVNDTPQGVIVSVLASALNLGLLPLADPSTVLTADFASVSGLPAYYGNVVDGTPAYNLYAALLHSTGDQVYAFPFDDVAGESSLMSGPPSSVATVTLNSLAGITPPPLTSSSSYDVTLVAGAGGSGSVTYGGTVLAFSNPPSAGSAVSVNLPSAPATFTVSYDTGGGAREYTINMATQSACPFTGVVLSAITGGTQIAWPGA